MERDGPKPFELWAVEPQGTLRPHVLSSGIEDLFVTLDVPPAGECGAPRSFADRGALPM
jgi:hypothetical protein